MANIDEIDPALAVQTLRRNRCACLVLAEVLAQIAEEPAEDATEQMDRLYGVSFLLDLVGTSVSEVVLATMNNPAGR